VRHLAGEVGAEYGARRAAAPGAAVGDLLALLAVILPHNMSHNAEVEAVDLCLETEQLDALAAPGAVDEASHARVCRYLLKSADYLGDAAEAAHAQEVAFALFTAHRQFAQALVAALRLGGPRARARVEGVFAACPDGGVRRQMGHLLGRHRLMSFIARDDAVDAAIGNAGLAALYAALARDLDVVEPKTPDDIYKTHLAGAADRGGAAAIAVRAARNCAVLARGRPLPRMACSPLVHSLPFPCLPAAACAARERQEQPRLDLRQRLGQRRLRPGQARHARRLDVGLPQQGQRPHGRGRVAGPHQPVGRDQARCARQVPQRRRRDGPRGSR
jgi:hypothetical protein